MGLAPLLGDTHARLRGLAARVEHVGTQSRVTVMGEILVADRRVRLVHIGDEPFLHVEANHVEHDAVPVTALGPRPELQSSPVFAMPGIEQGIPIVQAGLVVQHVAGVSPKGDHPVDAHGFSHGVIHAFAWHLPCFAAFAGRPFP